MFPYLLGGLAITRANQVWASDVTYIPMRRALAHLVVVMDVFSRRVLSWRLSNTMCARFCVDALAEAIAWFGVPEIVNTDQGSQAGKLLTQSERETGLPVTAAPLAIRLEDCCVYNQ